MLDRLVSFFGALAPDAERADPRGDDPRVAAAALMFHVIDADGVYADSEHHRLRQVLAEAYQLGDSELDRILRAGEIAHNESIDLFASTSVINRSLDEASRIELIGLLWEIVFADGELHELEDNVVWRVAELIGVSPRDRVLARQRVQGVTPGRRGDEPS